MGETSSALPQPLLLQPLPRGPSSWQGRWPLVSVGASSPPGSDTCVGCVPWRSGQGCPSCETGCLAAEPHPLGGWPLPRAQRLVPPSLGPARPPGSMCPLPSTCLGASVLVPPANGITSSVPCAPAWRPASHQPCAGPQHTLRTGGPVSSPGCPTGPPAVSSALCPPRKISSGSR